jgi:hypothetical protein
MPRRKAQPTALSSLIDAGSEDDFAHTEEDMSAMLPTPDSAENKRTNTAAKRKAPVSSARTKPAAKKTAAATARKTDTKTNATKTKRGRPALKDRTNVRDEDAVDELDELDEIEEDDEPKRKRAKGASAVNENTTKRKPARSAQATSTARAERAGSAVPRQASVIPEMQPEPSIELDDVIEMAAPVPAAPSVVLLPRATNQARSTSRQPDPVVRARSISRQPEPTLSRHMRTGSASSVERGMNDPALRRKVGELTSKYESLEIRYNNLKDVASTEAQSSFEKLKNATELRAKSTLFKSLLNLRVLLI